MNGVEAMRESLRAKYPAWDIWFILLAAGGTTTWHCKPKGAPASVRDADSAKELDAWLSMQAVLDLGDRVAIAYGG